jgi:hypothetical protein
LRCIAWKVALAARMGAGALDFATVAAFRRAGPLSRIGCHDVVTNLFCKSGVVKGALSLDRCHLNSESASLAIRGIRGSKRVI